MSAPPAVSRPIGAVLAGGAGRRMGGAKTLVQLDGRPLLHYPLAALHAAVGEVVVVCKQDTPLPELQDLVAVWCEPDEPRHPLAGVAWALRQAGGRPVLACAMDMPLVSFEALRALLRADPAGAPAVVPRAGGRLQPLLALYRHDALDVLAAMRPGEPATAVVERMGPLVVDVDDADAFLNVNAPEDLLHASALRASRR